MEEKRDYADALLHILSLQKKATAAASYCDFNQVIALIQDMTDTIFAYPSIKKTTEMIWDHTMKEIGNGLIHCKCNCKREEGAGVAAKDVGAALEWMFPKK